MFDLVLALPQGIEQTDVAVAANAEYVGYFFLDQEVRNEVSAFHARHLISFPVTLSLCLGPADCTDRPVPLTGLRQPAIM
jgi:hypothetical protein